MTAFVIGNGLSRKGIDLTKLDGTTYGCNWLYKDFKPDVLVAVDNTMSEFIQNSYYPKFNKFYTRRAYANTGALQLKPQFKNWASGPNAVQLAVLDKHKAVILLGFDLGGNTTKFNNVYAGTQFYKDSHSRSTYAGGWINQLNTIFKMTDWVNFKIVIGNETCDNVHSFEKFKNVTLISKADFLNEYVDNKDHK